MINVAMFFGGRSYEKEISVLTAAQVGTFFPSDYNLIPLFMCDGKLYVKKDFDRLSTYSKLKNCKQAQFISGGIKVGHKKIKIDCALLCNHGGEGEDGCLQSVLEYFDIPYTSSSPVAQAICMDKALTKTYLKAYGFSVVDDWRKGDYPCIIKPCKLGSSIGITIAKNPDEFEKGVNFAKLFGDYILEPFLNGATELNCAVVNDCGNLIVSAIEKPIHDGEYLDFDNKYKVGKREIPAQISAELQHLIEQTSVEIYQKLALFGVVRIDYLYFNDNLYVNEINTIPGSLAYYLFSEKGIVLEKLIRILVDSGIQRGVLTHPHFESGILNNYLGGGCKTKT